MWARVTRALLPANLQRAAALALVPVAGRRSCSESRATTSPIHLEQASTRPIWSRPRFSSVSCGGGAGRPVGSARCSSPSATCPGRSRGRARTSRSSTASASSALPRSIAMSLYLCLAFSTGRLRTAADRRLLVDARVRPHALLRSVAAPLPVARRRGTARRVRRPAAPRIPFQIGSDPQLLETVATFVTYVGLAVVAGIAVVWIRRFRAATRPQRRTLLPGRSRPRCCSCRRCSSSTSRVLVIGVGATRSTRSRGCSSGCGSCSRSASRPRSCRQTSSPAARSASS